MVVVLSGLWKWQYPQNPNGSGVNQKSLKHSSFWIFLASYTRPIWCKIASNRLVGENERGWPIAWTVFWCFFLGGALHQLPGQTTRLKLSCWNIGFSQGRNQQYHCHHFCFTEIDHEMVDGHRPMFLSTILQPVRRPRKGWESKGSRWLDEVDGWHSIAFPLCTQ